MKNIRTRAKVATVVAMLLIAVTSYGLLSIPQKWWESYGGHVFLAITGIGCTYLMYTALLNLFTIREQTKEEKKKKTTWHSMTK